ncbi:hypothetical protein UFOVP1604_181 [uncultured Caudovirales phage]|uniref:Uncharacterized protein n=1 Tax=uncultured Caudovirales phage TaxID=2100421 RepID=A0A6J5SU86_9CAUD|nr:hypothetical protein UFOVP1604_181 [uncultured Caudovirales phage]
MQTLTHASTMAEMAVDILFSEGDPFRGKVDRLKLYDAIRQATLKKLVIEDDDILDEEEFQECLKVSKIENC